MNTSNSSSSSEELSPTSRQQANPNNPYSPSSPNNNTKNTGVPKVTFPAHWKQVSSRRLPFFSQPTRIHFHGDADADPNRVGELGVPDMDMEYHWSSRAHRKGRWPVAKPRSTSEKTEWTHQRARVRFWGWDLGDISWWVAVLFLVGSIFWCANGVLAFCFYTLSTPHILLSEAATAFIGGTLFWIGAYLSYVEALNPAAHAHFGWEVDHELKRLVEPPRSSVSGTEAKSLGRGRRHFGKHVQAATGGSAEDSAEKGKADIDNEDSQQGNSPPSPPKWKWVGADWSSFGFVANVIQLYGATIL
ncbi:hypothetical protein FRC01_005218 [Tulasnella sp. 417]|nr:hypothetical protein FRC01_005218 [Tulasnella sp. 417]